MIHPRRCVPCLLLAVLAIAGGAGCGKSSTSPSGSTPVTGTLATVFTNDLQTEATQETGTLPASSAGPVALVTSNTNAIDGGSNLVVIHGGAPFSQVLVGIANGTGATTSDVTGIPQAASGTTTTGYLKLTLPAAVTSQAIIVNFGKAVPFTTFDMQVVLVSPSGAVGAAAIVHTTLLAAATGQVQVTASWDQVTDVDLHVVEPNQNEIFWAAPSSATGGALDLDSNMACSADGKNTENIRWTTGAPAGDYIVRLDYFEHCGVTAATNYVVTVNNGAARTIFTGSFAQADQDFGNLGAGRTITTFTHAASSAAMEFFTPPPPAPVPSPIKLRLSVRR